MCVAWDVLLVEVEVEVLEAYVALDVLLRARLRPWGPASPRLPLQRLALLSLAAARPGLCSCAQLAGHPLA